MLNYIKIVCLCSADNISSVCKQHKILTYACIHEQHRPPFCKCSLSLGACLQGLDTRKGGFLKQAGGRLHLWKMQK